MREFNIYIDGNEVTDAIEDTYNSLAQAELITTSVDFIAYTDDFERLYERVFRVFPITRNETYKRLMNLRKQGKCHAPKGRRRAETNDK